ncbi:MAG: hypothetical protein NVSMB52_18220 [Chloroflexota bacterium]
MSVDNPDPSSVPQPDNGEPTGQPRDLPATYPDEERAPTPDDVPTSPMKAPGKEPPETQQT